MRLPVLLLALLLASSVSSRPAEAGKRVVTSVVKAGATQAYAKKRHFRRFHRVRPSKLFRQPLAFVSPTGFAVPIRRGAPSPYAQRIRFPRAPWSYSHFRRSSGFEQKSHLWQSHIEPGPTYPNY